MRRSSFPPSNHIDDVLPDLALGRPFHVAEEAHMSDCQRCSERFLQLRKRVTTTLESVHNATSLRALLAHMLSDLEVRGDLVQFAPEVAELLDLPEDRAWALLEKLEDESTAWEPGPAPGIDVLPLKSGARWRGTECIAVRARGGAKYPHHGHTGNEYQIVLQGGFRIDDDGTEVWRGERIVDRQGTSHSLTILEGPDCIVVARIEPSF